jgi:hypothetical protein
MLLAQAVEAEVAAVAWLRMAPDKTEKIRHEIQATLQADEFSQNVRTGIGL